MIPVRGPGSAGVAQPRGGRRRAGGRQRDSPARGGAEGRRRDSGGVAESPGRSWRLYARCGIPEYWILALPDARLEVYRDPVEGGYRSITKHAAGDSVAPLARPDALHVWLAADRSLKCGINPFEIRVAENGDTWIERLRWVRRTSTPSGPKLERPGVTPSTLTRDRD